MISCDPVSGFISAVDVFHAATSKTVKAILFYSALADYCNLQDYSGTYQWIYSMKSQKNTQQMLQAVQTPDAGNNGQVYAAIGYPGSIQVINGTDDGSGTTSNQAKPSNSNNQNDDKQKWMGRSTTAVAMIILYAITGLITALFLMIIITGAFRAHRHPERYGPRNAIGQTRRSRAKGLARAMLDTLPIVKFGEREEPKPADVELAAANSEGTATRDGQEAAGQEASAETQSAQPEQTDRARQSAEGGIAAATDNGRTTNPNHLGCSICTEDFETGQDQRVLPCDHRFHPECVDPWLLNVSGTCPLCRIDLRPEASRTSESGERDEDGNPVLREGEFEPPPLAPQGTDGERQRMSIRRSIALGIMGIGRPDQLTREERVLALRQLRGRQLARQRREEQAAVVETPEEETHTRRRLRDVLGIRTRRTGQQAEQRQDDGGESGSRRES